MTEVVSSANPGLSQPLLAKRTSKRWLISAVLTTAIVALPVLSVIFLALFPDENIWPHLIETTLPRYLTTTIKLMIGVGALTLLIGLATACVSGLAGRTPAITGFRKSAAWKAPS